MKWQEIFFAALQSGKEGHMKVLFRSKTIMSLKLWAPFWEFSKPSCRAVTREVSCYKLMCTIWTLLFMKRYVLQQHQYPVLCWDTTFYECIALNLKKDSVSCALVWSGVASKRPAGVAVVAQMALLKDFFVVHPQLPSGVEELPQLFRSLQGQEAVAQPGQVVQQHGGIAKAFFSSALVRPALQCGLRRSAELTSAERARHEVAGVCQNFHVNVMDLCHWEQKRVSYFEASALEKRAQCTGPVCCTSLHQYRGNICKRTLNMWCVQSDRGWCGFKGLRVYALAPGPLCQFEMFFNIHWHFEFTEACGRSNCKLIRSTGLPAECARLERMPSHRSAPNTWSMPFEGLLLWRPCKPARCSTRAGRIGLPLAVQRMAVGGP